VKILMNLFRKCILYIIGLFLFCGLISCYINSWKQNRDGGDLLLNTIVESEKIESTDFATEYDTDFADYDHFINKIWVLEDFQDIKPFNRVSFTLYSCESGVVEGNIGFGIIVEPPFYSSNYLHRLEDVKSKTYSPNLTGFINEGLFVMKFQDEHEGSGVITFKFNNNNNKLNAEISFNERGVHYNDEILGGIYRFKPYNLSDLDGFTKDEAHSFEVDLNTWGKVNLVSGLYRSPRIMFPDAFLTDEHGNIIYDFDAPFPTATKIISASIEDINQDGLKDISITTGFFTYDTDLLISDMPLIKSNFLQMKNGLFYDSILDKQEKT
jgi:hypothetical protein